MVEIEDDYHYFPATDTVYWRGSLYSRGLFENTTLMERLRRSTVAKLAAVELLMDHLDQDQKVDYIKNGSFIVRAPSGSSYRIKEQNAGNVVRFVNGLFEGYYCLMAPVAQPVPDQMLAQKFMIECDEEKFLKMAQRRSP